MWETDRGDVKNEINVNNKSSGKVKRNHQRLVSNEWCGF